MIRYPTFWPNDTKDANYNKIRYKQLFKNKDDYLDNVPEELKTIMSDNYNLLLNYLSNSWINSSTIEKGKALFTMILMRLVPQIKLYNYYNSKELDELFKTSTQSNNTGKSSSTGSTNGDNKQYVYNNQLNNDDSVIENNKYINNSQSGTNASTGETETNRNSNSEYINYSPERFQQILKAQVNVQSLVIDTLINNLLAPIQPTFNWDTINWQGDE